ncbi:MAG: DUF983 domain-containing protein [Rhodospirillales bacterium]|nr:DUF983 domain-containing protein [Rhodospirillales bacterium]
MTLSHWPAEAAQPAPPWPVAPLATAIGRGLLSRCPACGERHLFKGYLKVVSECRRCGAPLGLARADDAPPYFTILVVGHIVVPLLVIMQRLANPPTWEMTAIFVPLTLVLALGLLRPIKGGTVGLMLTMGMLKPNPAAT